MIAPTSQLSEGKTQGSGSLQILALAVGRGLDSWTTLYGHLKLGDEKLSWMEWPRKQVGDGGVLGKCISAFGNCI